MLDDKRELWKLDVPQRIPQRLNRGDTFSASGRSVEH